MWSGNLMRIIITVMVRTLTMVESRVTRRLNHERYTEGDY